MRGYCLMSTESGFGKMKKFWRWIVMMVAQQCGCTYCHWIVHLKWETLCIYYHDLKKKTEKVYLFIKRESVALGTISFCPSHHSCDNKRFLFTFPLGYTKESLEKEVLSIQELWGSSPSILIQRCFEKVILNDTACVQSHTGRCHRQESGLGYEQGTMIFFYSLAEWCCLTLYMTCPKIK